MDEHDLKSIDPEAEVKKLQNLVMKLEKQNLLLRSKNSLEKDAPPMDSAIQSPPKENLVESSNGHGISFPVFDRLELVELEHSSEPSDDAYFYKSPVKMSPEQQSLDVREWARAGLDAASPDLEVTRRSLLYKLENVLRDMPFTNIRCGDKSAKITNGHSTANGMPAIKPPLITSFADGESADSARVNTATFCRPRSKVRRQLSTGYEDEEEEDFSTEISLGEVAALAKMQEESLRQSFNLGGGKMSGFSKSQGRQALRGFSDAAAGREDGHSEGLSLSASHGNLISEAIHFSNTSLTRSNSSLNRSNGSLHRSNSLSSTLSEDLNSPQGSREQLDSADLPQHTVPSPVQPVRKVAAVAPSLHLQAGSASSQAPPRMYQRETSPSKRSLSPPSLPNQNRVQSPGRPGPESPVRNMSPQRSAIPNRRGSGIPRPGAGSPSKLPQKKSGMASNLARRGNDWNDGCF